MKQQVFKIILILIAAITISACNHTIIDPTPPPYPYFGDIRINQLGYYPGSPKTVVVVDSDASSFQILDSNKNVVFEGTLVDRGTWAASGEKVKIGDFTSFQVPGTYEIYVEYVDTPPYDFEISDTVYSNVLKGALKSYYYLRATVYLPEVCAGIWARDGGHPDIECILDSSTGKTGTISSPGGWYDAGDYGKYIVNAGITVSTLLSLHELYPHAIGDDLNIPRSGNAISDLVDEVSWELDWMETMQDTDGGVFFKIGGTYWPDSVMPDRDLQDRYVFGKSTSSTLNFAANMAQAGRVYASIYPAVADEYIERAEKAWTWAIANNDVPAPKHTGGTGPYDDSNFDDEFLWAASELYITTGKVQYKQFIESNLIHPVVKGKAWWQDTQNLAYFALISNPSDINPVLLDAIKTEVIRYADEIVSKANANPYLVPMDENDFTWGSHSSLCNYGVLLAYAYEMSKDQKYMDTVISILDYIMGKNATGYTAITGFGDNPPMHPHHRQSEADNVLEPVPGLVVGGPNKKQEDKEHAAYPSNLPAKSYTDTYASYASNENAINQNAPVVFLLGFVKNYKDTLK